MGKSTEKNQDEKKEVVKVVKPSHLRKKGTEQIYVYTDGLMARGDMVAHFPDGDNSGDDYNDPNKIQLVVEAIGKLPRTTGFTITGIPKTKLIAEIMEMSVTVAERDEAWALSLRNPDNINKS
jgi:hypothetical protein